MSEEIKVEKGIPMVGEPGYGWRRKYPFYKMEVGDSFFLPGDPKKIRRVVACAATNHGKVYNKKFSVRSMDGGVRVWRVS